MIETRQQMLMEDCSRAAVAPDRHLGALKGQCVLVTGGTGFAGSWLAQMVAFLNDHHQFNTHMILMSTNPQNFEAKAPHLAQRDDLLLVEQDVRSLVELPDVVRYVVNAAGTPDNRFHASNPVRTMETFCMGTHALLQAAIRLSDLRNILQISSGMVYGEQQPDSPPIDETMFGRLNPNTPSAVYPEAKRMAESLCAAFRTQAGLPISVARLFTFLGPYQGLDRPWAVNNFIRDGLRGGPIRVQGDGETVRSFMYGADLAYWLLRLLVVGASGCAYNVGSPFPVKLKELAERVASLVSTPSAVELNAMPSPKQSRTVWVPDVGLAQRDMDLRLTCDLEYALRRTIEWYQ
jgi:nucleoside-diphosphate-sugar epimerase